MLGPPASGKGTQAALIERRYGIPIASPGTILRKERQAATVLGIEAERLTAKGLLLPDKTVVALVTAWLVGRTDKFLFDGFPRTIGQAEALERVLEEARIGLDVVIALDADFATIEARVRNRAVCAGCGETFSVGLHIATRDDACPRCGGVLGKRPDDTLEVLTARMAEYRLKTEPLLAFYKERALLCSVDSSRSPDAVFYEITQLLEQE